MIKFDKVSERDVDFSIMRAFLETPGFAELFLKKANISSANIIHVEHSLFDLELGESDITVLAEKFGVTHALLIENKIDAKAMDEQQLRYEKRGDKGIASGKYEHHHVFITAPQKYLDNNEEAKKYCLRVSYEEMLEVFKLSGSSFDCELIKAAIEKNKVGYTVQEVPAITNFWRRLYNYCETSSYSVKMYPSVNSKGSRSSWPQFRIPLKGCSLFYKAGTGAVDLEFTGRLSDAAAIKSLVNPYKDKGMHWEETGKSLSLRLKAPKLDFTASFEEHIEEVIEVLSAVEKLTVLAVEINDIGLL